MAAVQSDPVANDLGQAVGDGAVSVADAWPLLKRQERCQLVDLLVSRIDVDEDTITVDFSGSDDSEVEKPAVSANSLPSPQGFESPREPATRHDNRLSNRDLATLLTVDEVADLLRRSSKGGGGNRSRLAEGELINKRPKADNRHRFPPQPGG